jgi:hypothetical protein
MEMAEKLSADYGDADTLGLRRQERRNGMRGSQYILQRSYKTYFPSQFDVCMARIARAAINNIIKYHIYIWK